VGKWCRTGLHVGSGGTTGIRAEGESSILSAKISQTGGGGEKGRPVEWNTEGEKVRGSLKTRREKGEEMKERTRTPGKPVKKTGERGITFWNWTKRAV